MSAMVQTFTDRPIAALLGLVGLVLLSGWPLLHSRHAILAAQFSIGAAFVGHYLLLEAWTGAAVTAVGAAQSLIALAAQDHPQLRRAAWAFLPLPALIAWSTWSGIATLFATIALTLMMVGRMQRGEARMRVVLLVATPFGMAHDLLIGSLPAFAGGAIALVLGGFVLSRLLTNRRRPGSPLPVRLASAFGPGRRLFPARTSPKQWSVNDVACP